MQAQDSTAGNALGQENEKHSTYVQKSVPRLLPSLHKRYRGRIPMLVFEVRLYFIPDVFLFW